MGIVALFSLVGVVTAVAQIGWSLGYDTIEERVKYLIICNCIDAVVFVAAALTDNMTLVLQSMILSKCMFMCVIDFKKTLE